MQNTTSLLYRLFLKKISFYNHTQDIGENFSFDYYNKDQLPKRLSFSKDKYGFNNGTNNIKPFSKKLKESEIKNIMIHAGGINYATANLEVNPNKVYFGMLKKIIYPTGGYSNIIYEANSTLKNEKKIIYKNEYIDLKKECNEPTKTESFSFISNGSPIILDGALVTLDEIHNNGTCQVQPDSAHDKYRINIYKDGVMIFTKKMNYGESLNPSNPFTSCVDSIDNYFDEPICTQEGSEYQIAITALSKPFNPAEGSVSFRYNGEEITEEVLKYGAGVRVKEISDYDGSSQYNKRTFYYNELKNYPSLKSSLSNIIEPTYWETLPMPVYCENNKDNNNDFHGKYPKFSITASSITQLFETRASTINYSAITELLDSKKYGAIERKYFEVIDDLPAHILNNPIYNTPLSNSQSSLYSNKLKEEVFYNSNGLKVKKRIFKYNELYKGNIPALTARKNLDILNVMLPNNFEKITHSASNYFNFFGVLKLKKIEKKEYLATNSIKTEENYIYGDSPYFQLKEKAISNSFDEVLKTSYKYPFDFPTNSKMQTLVAQNRIADPVEIQEKNEGTITKTSKMVYDATSQTSGLLLPVKTQIGKGDINSLEDRISFDNYDSKGNILQVSKADNGSTKTSYIWDAEGIYPLAKITNETYHSIPTNLINNIHAASQNNNETSLKNALEALHNHYKNKEVLVETYTYHPLFGMTSATDPSGLSTYYEYDGFGRLKTIKNNNKAKKESYSYQYDSNGIDNFVRTRTYKSLLGNKYIDNTIYLDGLGRPTQEIAHAQSGQGNDLITSIEYDGFGREFKKYLPYDRGNTSLSKDNDALNNALSFYDTPNFQNTNNPYSESLFEDSPLERVLKEAAPGDDWKMDSGRETEYEYDTNKDQEVRYFKVNNPTSSSMPTLEESSETYYASGQLYKTITKDENHQGITKVGTTEEFKNKLGQVILKRQWNIKNASPNGNTKVSVIALDTYYVYDDYGNLSFVLPPKLSEKIAAGNTNYNQLIDKLGYQYKYDHRNRMIQKKLPGRQIEYTAYDPSDRVIAVGPVSSPFNNEEENGILHTRYDAFDRVVHTSWSPVTSFDETARKNIENSISNTISEKLLSTPINSDGLKIHYSSQVAPPAGKNHYISSNLYDKYPSWIDNIPNQILSQNVFYDDNMPPKGLETATYNRVLESKSSTNAIHSYFLYDNEKRLLREHSQNHLGGYTQTDNKYNFIGEILKTQTRHKRTDADTELKIEEDFSYTEQNRLKKHTHQINSEAKEMIAFHEYDALGQLSAKKVGGENEDQFLQQVDYKYNIRGWLTDINSTSNLASKNQPQDLFAFHINYNLINNAHPSVRSLYNGNISQVYWRTSSDNILRSYDYAYDPLNRLLDAYYRIPNSSVQDSYNENLTYDSNGNILTLKRNGKEETEQQVFMIDDLDYEYEGNQLLNVTDDTNYSEGFDDGNKHQQTNLNDYEYDDYGNMTKDRNKGISQITYNHLNLPKKIKFGTAGTIEYIYNAQGEKLKKKVTEGSANKTVDYLDGFQYENGNLEFFPTAEGYVKATEIEAEEYAFNYVYNYTDHLGNVRLRYTKDPEDENKVRILEEDHYYPFGMKHQGYNNEHEIIVPPFTPMPLYPTIIIPITPDQEDSYQYKYNGKEFQEELGLNWYDYGARNYDAAIGRWMNVDPLAEVQPNKTPYHFVSNNPITRVDPTGMLDHEYDKDGNKISDLGGDKIDFHHQANGDTKIVDKQTGASNIIAGGEALIRGYTQRDNSTGWGTLFNEWDQGTGPTKSMFADFDNTSTGVFGSFDKTFSVYAGKARADVMNGGADKGRVNFSYGDINPLTAGFDGWEQFIGRANLSYYKLGDKVLYMMNDSKSMTSFLYRMSPSWERSDFRLNGNTYQTYIWTETMQEVQNKNQIRVDYINQLQKARQEYRNTEHQRLPAIKW